jgi:hypothetical protein
LIFVVAEIATRVLPQGSLVGGVGPSTENLAGNAMDGQVAFDLQFSIPDDAAAQGADAGECHWS